MDPVSTLYTILRVHGGTTLEGVVASDVTITASPGQDYGYEEVGNILSLPAMDTFFGYNLKGDRVCLDVFVQHLNFNEFAEYVILAQEILKSSAALFGYPAGEIRFTIATALLQWDCLVSKGDAIEMDFYS
jgi:hypothetical protein